MNDLRSEIMKIVRPSTLILNVDMPHEINVYRKNLRSSLLELSNMIERSSQFFDMHLLSAAGIYHSSYTEHSSDLTHNRKPLN